MTTKPNLVRVWAAGAPGGNIEDPDVTTPGKFAAGWTAEIPPFEHFNFLQQLFTQALAHINEQGITQWDLVTPYPIGGWAKSTVDDLVYVALTTNVNKEPSANPADWETLSSALGISAFGLFSNATANITTGYTTNIEALGVSITTITPDLTTEVLKEGTVTGNLTINEPTDGSFGACLILLKIDASGPYTLTLGAGVSSIGTVPDLEANGQYECRIVKHSDTLTTVEIGVIA